MRDFHVMNFVRSTEWAVTPKCFTSMLIALHQHQHALPPVAFDRRPPPPTPPPAGSGIALVAIHGVIAPRITMLSDMSGGATFEDATEAITDAGADPNVGAIILDWNSPGGACAGATEFAAVVRALRAVKRVVSHAHYEMCSAAYWTGCNASEVTAAPSAHVGSIGVYAVHEDLSGFLEQAGIKLTYVAEGKYKVDGNEAGPLTDTALARMKVLTGGAMDHFVSDVALGRHVSGADVRGGFGQGSVLTADEALAAGLIDRIETLDQTIARVQAELSPTSAVIARRAQAREYEHALYRLSFS